MSAPRTALRWVREQRGAVMIEYALVLTLVALGLIAALVLPALCSFGCSAFRKPC